MIKVIILDLKDGEVQSIERTREILLQSDFQRAIFRGDVGVRLDHFLNKIKRERWEKETCQKP